MKPERDLLKDTMLSKKKEVWGREREKKKKKKGIKI